MSDSERRQFFRARCQALVDVKQVDKAATETTDADTLFSDGNELALVNDLQRLGRECAQVGRGLNKVDANLLDYLKLTHHKIDQLSQIVLSRLPALNTLPKQSIDLSENGLGFCGDRFFYLDSILALRLVFLPHYTSVVLFAKVVRCDPDQRESYHIAAEFLPLTEATRRTVAQQVLRAQRQAKLNPGTESGPDDHNDGRQ